MTIENDQQLGITNAWIGRFSYAVTQARARKMRPDEEWIRTAEIQGMLSIIAELETEIDAYEKQQRSK